MTEGSPTGLSAIDRLRAFLRPPGKGLYTHSAGAGFAQELLTQIYGTYNHKEVQDKWEEGFQRIRRIEAVVLGVPSDVGAGIMRGANFGPIGVREAFLRKYGAYPKSVLDIGDVICIPQLLHDSMLSHEQIDASRHAIYGKNLDLPVSPLSITEGVLKALLELNRDLKVYMIGGDHSVSWPAMVYCHDKWGKDFGVLHFDAHTDLMESRLGVRYCFGTWAFQALSLMKPHGMVQVGIRTSKHPKEYWTTKYPLKQIWASEVEGNEEAIIQGTLQHFHELGIKGLYISNDIDGTDESFAPATGTPETGGLSPKFVLEFVARMKKEFPLIGGDVVEVAPPLSGSKTFSTEKTCVLAADYLKSFF